LNSLLPTYLVGTLPLSYFDMPDFNDFIVTNEIWKTVHLPIPY
jgi:hypothetical protein